jgi:hypothetical protein
MPVDSTYTPGVYRKAGSNILVVGPAGRLATGAGSAAQSPATGTLNANVVSATLTGNDFAGSVVIVSSATPPAAGQALFVVTFATPRATAPIVILTNLGCGAADASHNLASYGATVTTTGFTVVNTVVLGTSSTVTMGYMVIDVE